MVVKPKNRSCVKDSQGVRVAGRRKGLKRRKMSRKNQDASELQRITAGTRHSRKILDNAKTYVQRARRYGRSVVSVCLAPEGERLRSFCAL